jgi:acetyltransferase
MDRTLDPIMRPRSIAIIGASRSPNTIGHQILANLVGHGFSGPVYPVNPNAESVHSIRAYPSVAAIPGEVDLAVIVVPRGLVHEVAEECGGGGVKGLVVISAGFKEVGSEGAEREQRLVDIIRRFGMRMVGPNCMGVLNSDPAISMKATFAPVIPPFGSAAFVSQSGAIGANVLDYASEFGIGISQFVSVGNKPDVSGNDLLVQWEDDPTVGLILMYVENFGNPRNFLTIARRVTRKKPIIVVKSGRSEIGSRAASSHTGAIVADDDMVEALLAQAGVLRAGSIEEMFDMAMAFTGHPLPQSRRTAVLTNAGGPGILAADALEMHGLDLVELSDQTVERLRPLFPAEASLRNPLDMIASATPAGYLSALDAILSDPQVSSTVAIFVPPLGIRQEEVAEAIGEAAARHPEKPVLAVLMGREGLPQGRAELHRAGIPAYVFPESAARALSAVCRHQEWRGRNDSLPTLSNIDRDRAGKIMERAIAGGEKKMPEHDVLDLLESYGVAIAPAGLARSREEAVSIAERISFPVVMKIVAPHIVHKSDVGGVRVGIDDRLQAAEAYDELIAAAERAFPGEAPDGVLVQKMLGAGREMIVGVVRDPSFGPMVMFGLGGAFVEVLRDVVFRIAPITDFDAREMIRGIRSARVLDRFRGQPPADVGAIVEALLRISQLAMDMPEIEEIEINPLLALPDGAVAIDGRVLIGIEAREEAVIE